VTWSQRCPTGFRRFPVARQNRTAAGAPGMLGRASSSILQVFLSPSKHSCFQNFVETSQETVKRTNNEWCPNRARIYIETVSFCSRRLGDYSIIANQSQRVGNDHVYLSSIEMQLKLMMRATTRRAKNQSSSEESTRCGELNRQVFLTEWISELQRSNHNPC
jgi:hypothetical protein